MHACIHKYTAPVPDADSSHTSHVSLLLCGFKVPSLKCLTENTHARTLAVHCTCTCFNDTTKVPGFTKMTTTWTVQPWGSSNAGWDGCVCNCFPTPVHTIIQCAVLSATPAIALRLKSPGQEKGGGAGPSFAQKRSWARRWNWAPKVGLLLLQVVTQQQCNRHCPCDSALHVSWNSNCVIH